MPKEEKKFQVENAEILWPNFSGRASDFNKEGDRNFVVVIDEDMAAVMAADGWNVKCTIPDEENPITRCVIQVTVKYRNKLNEKVKPPKIVMISSSGRTNITEDTVSTLDEVDIKQVDLIARAYEWTVNGKSGITAYLKTMYVTIDEDALDRKYAPKVEEKHGA
jgi:hypothetical protein